MKNHYAQLIQQAYEAFNRRDISTVLLLMAEDVWWPNGWEGGFVNGHNEVKEYWLRQWKEIDPIVTPVLITELPNNTFDVEVRQTIRSKTAEILSDGIVHHIYTFENGKIQKMEIANDNG